MAIKLEELKQKFQNFDCDHKNNSPNNLKDPENFLLCNDTLLDNGLLKCAVLIILFRSNNQFYMIFTVRSLKLKSFPGEICFPGGKFDRSLDNSYFDTALREASEEIGLKKENFHKICQMCPFISPVGHWISPVIGILCDNINNVNPYDDTLHIAESLKANEDEVSLIFWKPVSYFLDKNRISFVEVPVKIDDMLKKESIFEDKPINSFNRLILQLDDFPLGEGAPSNTILYGINATITIACILILSENFSILEIPGFEIKNGLELKKYLHLFRYTAFLLYKNNKLARERKSIKAKL